KRAIRRTTARRGQPVGPSGVVLPAQRAIQRRTARIECHGGRSAVVVPAERASAPRARLPSRPAPGSRVEALAERVEGLVQGAGKLGCQGPCLAELLEDLRLLGLQEAVEARLELLDPRRRDVVELALRGGVQDRDLLLDREWLILRLLDDLGQLLAPSQLI